MRIVTSWGHMRRFAWSNKKVRGIPRRLRALAQWAADFDDEFPIDNTDKEPYYNFKIPIHENLVCGKNSKLAIRRECAQRLIDACFNLINSKPETVKNYRVVVILCLPDMFMSEVCIFIDEMSFRRDTQPKFEYEGRTYHRADRVISDRSLAKEWGIILPPGVFVHGVHIKYENEDDYPWFNIRDRWYFGEVLV